MLRLDAGVHAQMLAHAYDGLPDEACGLLAGPRSGECTAFYPCTNVARSSRIYRLDPTEVEQFGEDAWAQGLQLIGVMHSHTHTEPVPSATDIEAADPFWHYVIVSLKRDRPQMRSWRIDGESVDEEPVALESRPV